MAQINVRVDDVVKKEAESICEDIGITLSTAINVYLKKIIKERQIPFMLSSDPFYSKENMTRLERSIQQMETTGGTIHEVDHLYD